MNRAQHIITSIDQMFEEESPLLEGSMNEKGRFTLRAYDPETQKALFKAHANTHDQVKSLLSNAADHMRDGGMHKIRLTVHDQKGHVYDHKMVKAADGKIHTSGPSVDNDYED